MEPQRALGEGNQHLSARPEPDLPLQVRAARLQGHPLLPQLTQFQPTDTPDRIDYESCARVVAGVIGATADG